MKFMNQSRFFGSGFYCRIPMRLQLFAEGGEGEGSGTPDDAGGAGGKPDTGKPDGEGDETPTYEQLVAQLAQERADKEKYKNLNDKTSREAADYKKQLRAKMTAEEQEAIAKQEAKDALEKEIAELKARERVRDYTELLMDKEIGMSKKDAGELAQNLVDGDFEKALSVLGNHIKSIKDNSYQQALKNRPDIAAGNGEPDKNALGDNFARNSAKRVGGANEDILKYYRR